MPLHSARENTGALLHEVVHIDAPNTIRFLAEGLAVYLHAKLAGHPAFPNFGVDVRRLAVRGLAGVESLDALNGVRTPQRLGTVMEEKTAYMLAGSVVGCVIERYGLASFRRVYETGHDEEGDGKSLGTLEQAWRVSLQGHERPLGVASYGRALSAWGSQCEPRGQGQFPASVFTGCKF